MTLDKAREIIADHAAIAGGYNMTAAKIVLGELQNDVGQKAVDTVIIEYNLQGLWGFAPGSHFDRMYK